MTGTPSRGRRRVAAVVLLLLLLIVAGGILARRDREPAPGPAAGRARVVHVVCTAEDELDLIAMGRRPPDGAASVLIVEEDEEPARLWLGPEPGRGESLAGARFVVIEDVVYEGRGRHGATRRVRSGRDLPAAAAPEIPAEIRIGLEDDGLTRLEAVLPQPEGCAWAIDGDDLVVAGRRLGPGEEIELPPAEARVRVVQVRRRPIPLGEVPEDPFAAEEEDHGAVLFRTRTRIRNLGEIEIREGKE